MGFSAHVASGITLISYAHNRKIGETNNVYVIESKQAKGHTRDSQNCLLSPTPKKGEP